MELSKPEQLVLFHFKHESYTNTEAFSEFVDWFVQNSILMKILPEEDKLGIFIYSKEDDKIVFANHTFLQTYQISIEKLQRPAIRRLIFMKLHKDDVRYIHFLEWKAAQQQNVIPINRVIRISQEDKTYKPYHLLVFSISNFIRTLKEYRLGIVINVPEFWSHEEITDPQIASFCKKVQCLSKREKDIVELIVNGATDKEIGRYLHISPLTAQKHRKNILKKLELKNTANLAFVIGKCRLV